MRVPRQIVGRTSPSAQGLAQFNVRASPDAFGAGIGRGMQQLGNQLQQRAELRRREEEQERKQLQDFQARKLFATETLATERDLNDRVLQAPLGAEGFTDSLLVDYEAKHNSILDDMRAQGYDEEVIQATDLRFAGMREGLQSRGMRFQNDSQVAKVNNDISEMGLDLSQLASMQPAEMEGAIELLEESIDQIPGIDSITRQRIKDEQRSVIVRAAGLGLAQRDPQTVVSLLGGDSGDYFSKIRTAESGGNDAARNPGSTATGRYQFLTGTWRELVRRYPDSGLTADGRLDPEQQEIAIRLFTAENSRALEVAGIPSTHANLYAAHFLGAGGARLVLSAGDGESIASIVPPQVIEANSFLRGMTVADFKAWTMRKTGGGQLSTPTDGKTGNPVLDAMSVAERQQVLSAAQTALNQQQAQFRAGVELNIENATAAYMQGQDPNGPIPTAADFYRAYEPLQAEQKLAAFQAVQRTGTAIADMKTMTPEQIGAAVAQAMPVDRGQPTYAVEVAGAQAVQAAAKTVMEQRAADPAGYAMRNFPSVQSSWQAAGSGQGSMSEAFTQLNSAYDTLGVPVSQRKAFPAGAVQGQIDAMASMSPEQKVAYLGNLKNQAGSLFGPALSQLAEGGARTEAYLAGLVAQDPNATTTAANVLRGMQIIAEDPTRKPSETLLKSDFRRVLGDAQNFLDPSSSGAMYESAMALYVQKGGAPDSLDTGLFEEAIAEVAGGGIMRNGGGGLFSSAMPSTILPPGVDEATFLDFTDNLTDGDLLDLSLDGGMPLYTTGEPATASDIYDQGKFVRVGPTQYIIMMTSDNQPLVNAQGQRYVIQLDREAVLDRIGAN